MNNYLGADLRSLALFRIAAASIVMIDLALRSTDLTAFYTDAGVLPTAILKASFHIAWPVNYWFPSSRLGAAIVFGVCALSALGFLLGYRTRGLNFACWFLMSTLELRNPLITQMGDRLLRLLLFWGLFLPLGERFSIDARRSPSRRGNPGPFLSAGTVAFILQIFVMYEFSVLYKCTAGPSWLHGDAVRLAVGMDDPRPLATILDAHPGLGRLLTYMVLGLESLAPWLLFAPAERFRTGIVLILFLMHVAFGLFLRIGIFPWVCASALLFFLPAWFWRLLHVPDSPGPREHAAAVPRSATAGNLLVGSLSLCMIAWNTAGLLPVLPLPKILKEICLLTRLDQRWEMFIDPLPRKPRSQSWFQVRGEFQDGSSIDLSNNNIPDQETTWFETDRFKNQRWRRFYSDYADSLSHPEFVSLLGSYLCRSWNEGGHRERPLDSVDIIRSTPAQPHHPLETVIGRYRCVQDEVLAPRSHESESRIPAARSHAVAAVAKGGP